MPLDIELNKSNWGMRFYKNFLRAHRRFIIISCYYKLLSFFQHPFVNSFSWAKRSSIKLPIEFLTKNYEDPENDSLIYRVFLFVLLINDTSSRILSIINEIRSYIARSIVHAFIFSFRSSKTHFWGIFFVNGELILGGTREKISEVCIQKCWSTRSLICEKLRVLV